MEADIEVILQGVKIIVGASVTTCFMVFIILTGGGK